MLFGNFLYQKHKRLQRSDPNARFHAQIKIKTYKLFQFSDLES